MKRNVKIFCAALALVLVFGAVVGGTIAWLTAETKVVTNTFTFGEIGLEIAEEGAAVDPENSNLLTNSFKMVPGDTIDKKATVTVNAESEECWIFVKIEKSADFDSYLTYTPNTEDWALLSEEGTTAVYYVKADKAPALNEGVIAEDTTYSILANGGDNAVQVKGEVTQEMMDLVSAGTAKPSLSFTAYACQKLGFNTAALAWAEVSNS